MIVLIWSWIRTRWIQVRDSIQRKRLELQRKWEEERGSAEQGAGGIPRLYQSVDKVQSKHERHSILGHFQP